MLGRKKKLETERPWRKLFWKCCRFKIRSIAHRNNLLPQDTHRAKMKDIIRVDVASNRIHFLPK